MQKNPSSVPTRSESLYRKSIFKGVIASDVTAGIDIVANLLAHGILRLLKRQKDLDKSTRESVHRVVLIPGKTP
jgi:hypothetical protein